MKKFDTMIAKCEDPTISTAEMADRVTKTYLALKKELEALEAQQLALRALALDVLEYAGESQVVNSYGKIIWVEPAETVRYDTKGIDAVCQVLPEVAQAVDPFRIVGERKGYVKVTK